MANSRPGVGRVQMLHLEHNVHLQQSPLLGGQTQAKARADPGSGPGSLGQEILERGLKMARGRKKWSEESLDRGPSCPGLRTVQCFITHLNHSGTV